jgi:hypothetical protein
MPGGRTWREVRRNFVIQLGMQHRFRKPAKRDGDLEPGQPAAGVSPQSDRDTEESRQDRPVPAKDTALQEGPAQASVTTSTVPKPRAELPDDWWKRPIGSRKPPRDDVP